MDQVRFGIVGFGAMGLQHARIMLEQVPEARLAAVATRNGTNIATLRGLPGGEQVRVFDTPQDMYASGEIDAVLIASPHRAHVAQAKEAFAAGMHVLLEKPTGVFTREVRELNAAADASGRAFGAMLNQRTNPVYRRMKEIVASGELGEIRRTSMIVTDWFRAQSYFDSGSWRATWKGEGGGVLLNQAMHSLDLWQWIGGMPVRLRAFCGLGRWHDIEVEDDVTAYVEYANGATGLLMACTGEAPGTNRFELSMDGGQLLLEDGRLLLRRTAVPVSRFIREYPGGYGKPEITQEDITPDADNPMHAGVTRAFARHILYGEPMIADGREGLNALELANAMLLSSAEERTLELPFDAETDARYEALLAARAACSREKTAREVRMDLGKSY